MLTDSDFSFESLKSPLFRPTVVAPTLAKKIELALGCGGTALLTLTGAKPDEILRFIHKFKAGDTSPGQTLTLMLSFLKGAGFDFKKISISGTCPEEETIVNVLGRSHVILSARHVAKNQTSWFVNWGGLEFHNLVETGHGQVAASFYNWPVTAAEGAYVVSHPDWRYDYATFRAAEMELDLNKRSLDELYEDAKQKEERANAVVDSMIEFASLLAQEAQEQGLNVSEQFTRARILLKELRLPRRLKR